MAVLIACIAVAVGGGREFEIPQNKEAPPPVIFVPQPVGLSVRSPQVHRGNAESAIGGKDATSLATVDRLVVGGAAAAIGADGAAPPLRLVAGTDIAVSGSLLAGGMPFAEGIVPENPVREVGLYATPHVELVRIEANESRERVDVPLAMRHYVPPGRSVGFRLSGPIVLSPGRYELAVRLRDLVSRRIDADGVETFVLSKPLLVVPIEVDAERE